MPERKIQRKLDELISSLKDGRFEYVPKEEKNSIDWASYDEAQINEMNEQLVLIRNLVDAANDRLGRECGVRGVGRPPKPVVDKTKAVLLQQYFQSSNRLTAGLTLLFQEKLNLSGPLHYKMIERAYGDPEVMCLLRLVFEMTHEPVSALETKFSIDGSGEPTSIKQNYANDRDNTEKHAGYQKFMGMCGVKYKLYSAIEFAEGTANESPFLVPLLNETSRRYKKVEFVYGDAAFLSRANCTAITQAGATPRIYPKEGITLKKRGHTAWTRMLTCLVANPQQWLREFHNRSISETTHSIWKRRFPRPLMKRLAHRRYTEEYTRKCDYNILRLTYINYLNDVKNPWNSN